jgi:CheY-like chemotaxis protein
MKNFLDLEISFLRRKDCRIITAEDGFEALKITKLEKPDIILLDHEMPKMTGIECTRIIKNDEALKHIPILMISSANKKDEAMRAGVDEYVKKPVSEDLFLKELKKFVDIKDRSDERVNVSVPVKYSAGKNKYTAFSRDISSAGLSVIAGDLLAVGTELNIDIDVGDDKGIKMKGDIVREMKEEHDGYLITGMGIKFTKISPEAKQRLEKFLSTKK